MEILEAFQTIDQKEDRRTRIRILMEKLTDNLPPMAQMMIKPNFGLVERWLDEVSDEQLDDILDRAQDVIDNLRE